MVFDKYIYVNMGVKRSVRTSGMQPTTVSIPQNCFRAKNGNVLIFPLYISEFPLYILRFLRDL